MPYKFDCFKQVEKSFKCYVINNYNPALFHLKRKPTGHRIHNEQKPINGMVVGRHLYINHIYCQRIHTG